MELEAKEFNDMNKKKKRNRSNYNRKVQQGNNRSLQPFTNIHSKRVTQYFLLPRTDSMSESTYHAYYTPPAECFKPLRILITRPEGIYEGSLKILIGC